MSTDETPAPRTRAEMRAAREAAAAAEAAAASGQGAEPQEDSTAGSPAPADAREAAMRAAMIEAAAAAEAAAADAAARSSSRQEAAPQPPAADPFARAVQQFSAQAAAEPRAESGESASTPESDASPVSAATGESASTPESDVSPVTAATGESTSTPESDVSPVTAATGESASTPDNDTTADNGTPASSATQSESGAEPEPSPTPGLEQAPDSAPAGATSARAVRGAPNARPPRRFLLTLAAVLGIFVVLGAGLGFVSLTQGPRITGVQVDPNQAIESSGSRVILTTNQALSAIDASQVTVEPAMPFTVDASGRGIGIRFTVPLDDATKYKITVADVESAGGGPNATLTADFKTPASTMFLLRRDAEGEDTIFLTDLSGEKARPVYSADKIDDFRATSTKLVVSIEENDLSELLVMDRDGKNPQKLKLPGKGYIGSIQVSERGGLVGYTYSDKEISETSGRASVLVTQSLSGKDDPQIAEVGGEESSILVWQFVPDSAAMLFIDFNGALSLIDHSSDAGVQSLGLAANIQGISRGTYTAIVERVDGSVVELNLADGSEQPLAASDPDYGSAITIVPFPGGTLRHVVSVDETGYPSGQAIIRVDDDGTATSLVQVGSTDSILQACASPSGQYAAVAIAPDLAKNSYDQMLLPLPKNVETHLLDLRTGKELVALTGFDSSWCATAPHY